MLVLVYDNLCHLQAYQGQIKINEIHHSFGWVINRLRTLLLFYCGKSFLKAMSLQGKINL